MIKFSNRNDKKVKIFIVLLLFFSLAGGACLGLNSNEILGDVATEELVVNSDIIKVSPDVNTGEATGELVAKSSNEIIVSPGEASKGREVSPLGAFNGINNSIPESSSSFEPITPTSVSPEQEVVPDSGILFENNENPGVDDEQYQTVDEGNMAPEPFIDDKEEQSEPTGDNNEDTQPQEPPYESTVYNFGNSGKFDLTQNVTQGDFNETFIVKQNSWKIDEDGSGLSPVRGGEGRVFIPNSYLDYFIKVFAALNEGTLNNEGQPRNDGGYGIMFETGLDEQNNDYGFALQFDRGYGNGEIIIRSREIRPNSQGNPQTYENTPPEFRFNNLPNKNEDPDWWEKEHQLMLEVKTLDSENEAGHNKSLSVSLDEEHLFDWTFKSEIENAEDNHVGLRVWHESAKNVDFIGLEVGELPTVKESKDQESSPQASTEIKTAASINTDSKPSVMESKEQAPSPQVSAEIQSIEANNANSNPNPEAE